MAKLIATSYITCIAEKLDTRLLLLYYCILLLPAMYPIIVSGALGIVLETLYGCMLTLLSAKLKDAPKQKFHIFLVIMPGIGTIVGVCIMGAFIIYFNDKKM